MNQYGLIGKNLTHSFSPEYFKQKFQKLKIDAEYKIYDIDDIEEFPDIIASNPSLIGLNVTIPYKRSLGSFMNSIDNSVNITGSINTIKIDNIKGKKVLSGYNTDVIGLEKTIKPIVKKNPGIKAMILGTGASANSVAYVLRKLGVLFFFVSRQPSKLLHSHYSWLQKSDFKLHNLIINTTPVGMFPDFQNSPQIPYEFITKDHILFDLIYNPNETLFLKKGRKIGARGINGNEMLKIQADASWNIWNK